ncbi:MAG: hypothetical protein OEZ38_14495 [Gammaproteobacteria bacterium]|nr:hypothetical protein [Gammaproteobacteria bacterium]
MPINNNDKQLDKLNEILPGVAPHISYVPNHHFHAATGRIDKLKDVLSKNPYKVNEADSRGQVTLVWPIFTAQIEIVEYCLEMGADPFLKPNPSSASPLEAAETMKNVSDAHYKCYELVMSAAKKVLSRKVMPKKIDDSLSEIIAH